MNTPWSDSEAKQDCRNWIVTAANQNLDTTCPLNIFTLPAQEALCAKTFRQYWPHAVIFGVERLVNVFKKVDRSSGIFMRRCSLNDYLKKDTTLMGDHFDVAFFDFTGAATEKNVKSVVKFVSNENVVHKRKKSVIAVTFNSNDRQYGVKRIANKINKTVHSEEDEVLNYNAKTAMNLLVEEIGESVQRVRILQILHYQTYKAQDDSVPMFFGILLIEKY
jgi:hypothetical protein